MELDEDNKPDAMEQDADNKPDSSSAIEQDADNKPAAVEKNSKVGMDVDAVDKGKKKMKKQWKTLKFDEYIYEVLKQVHPDIAISGEALDMMDNIINRMLSKISEESKKSTNLRGRTLTIHERDIIASVMKLFPKRMGDRAIVMAYNSSLYYSVDRMCKKIDKTKI